MTETITPKEIAARLGISTAYAYRMIKQKQLPGIRIGRRVIVPSDLFNRWLEQQTNAALAATAQEADNDRS